MGKRKPTKQTPKPAQKQPQQQKAKTSAAKDQPSLTEEKRKEQQDLVQQLLGVCFSKNTNPKEEWDVYVKVYNLLQRIMELEAPLRCYYMRTTTPEQRATDINNFYKWSVENGINYTGLRICEFPGYGLGLQATRDISKDDQLFSVPRKLIFTEENISKDDPNMILFKSMSNINLSYALMTEKMDPTSFWKPYIDLLPQSYDTPMYFTTEQMQQLKGSSIYLKAMQTCRAIARQYAFLSKCAQKSASQYPKQTLLCERFREQFSYEMYRWSVSTVMTRENMMPLNEPKTPTAVLVPFWDLTNHRLGHVTTFYNSETQALESTAMADVKAGDQIFMYYGTRSNSGMFLNNGFVDPLNTHDRVAIHLGLSASDALFEQRSKLLKLLNISMPDLKELSIQTGPNFITPELLGFVRVFNMNAEQLEHWILSERAPDLLHIDCALETSLDMKTWKYLETRLMLLLRVYPTTLEEDEERLAKHNNGSKSLAYIESMTLQYLVLEKRLLQSALAYCKERTKV